MADTNADLQAKVEVAFGAVRDHANKSMYGRYISDVECRSVATEVVAALEKYAAGKEL